MSQLVTTILQAHLYIERIIEGPETIPEHWTCVRISLTLLKLKSSITRSQRPCTCLRGAGGCNASTWILLANGQKKITPNVLTKKKLLLRHIADRYTLYSSWYCEVGIGVMKVNKRSAACVWEGSWEVLLFHAAWHNENCPLGIKRVEILLSELFVSSNQRKWEGGLLCQWRKTFKKVQMHEESRIQWLSCCYSYSKEMQRDIISHDSLPDRFSYPKKMIPLYPSHILHAMPCHANAVGKFSWCFHQQ